VCGIVGAIAGRNVQSILIEGLKRLEYRGYDSAGLVVLEQGTLHRKRALGKVQNLKSLLDTDPLSGKSGIAHTRWATHGVPNQENAHPHFTKDEALALVHNGIIENHEGLREILKKEGYQFQSDTDTEVIVHLLHHCEKEHETFLEALQAMAAQLEGSYALAIISLKEPNQLYALRHGSPLVLGCGIGENFIASDFLALMPVTQNVIYLEEGDIAKVSATSIEIYNEHLRLVERKQTSHEIQQGATDRGAYQHYMLKEIYEQPLAIRQTLADCFHLGCLRDGVFGKEAEVIFQQVKQVHIVACGTSYHAGLVASYWIEKIAGIPCRVEIASEWRYREKVIIEGSLFVCISQSGETADTLAALRQAKSLSYIATLAIGNVSQSSIMREAALCFMTRAGVEVGVASTKAFTTQLTALLMLTVALGKPNGIEPEVMARVSENLRLLPSLIETVLQLAPKIEKMASCFLHKNHALFLGRGLQYPIALEGALKLKEISYIHAQAYPGGELKHGPLALIDEDMPVIGLAPNDSLLDKMKSNLEEVRARGGKLFVFTEKEAGFHAMDGVTVVPLPMVDSLLAPVVYSIPMQLLAYYVAVAKGTDIDQPRNLAKSVTVE
jgi:glucosamine--fructose-6-phosphate aminotransferase (isomerizing)